MRNPIAWYRKRQRQKRLNAIRAWLSDLGYDVAGLSEDQLEALQVQVQVQFMREMCEVFRTAATAQRALVDLGASMKRFADSLALAAVAKE